MMAEQSAERLATRGRIDGGAHYMPLRVYYEDTDASGIVYYANYLRFTERARTDLLRLLGITHSGTMAADDVAFTVRRCEIDYRAPARLDDEIEVETRLVSVRGASLDAIQTVRRGGEDLVATALQIACIDSQGRARRLPKGVRKALESLTPKSTNA
ncbi:MAG TPA: tol-pal system-associated acyl-CoA thioesterase [Alphaproteobacteria bacterium]|jgi:acyl-CoA thioester hydrolase|nr:tol-pal system-associated acyl-CoA thioesterase [Alphaproteobacteria bacterium]